MLKNIPAGIGNDLISHLNTLLGVEILFQLLIVGLGLTPGSCEEHGLLNSRDFVSAPFVSLITLISWVSIILLNVPRIMNHMDVTSPILFLRVQI